jgi:hypothetical protein
MLQNEIGLAGVRELAGCDAVFDCLGPGFEKTASDARRRPSGATKPLEPILDALPMGDKRSGFPAIWILGTWPVSSPASIGRSQRRHGWPTSGWSARSGRDFRSPIVRRLVRDFISHSMIPRMLALANVGCTSTIQVCGQDRPAAATHQRLPGSPPVSHLWSLGPAA